MCSETSSRFLSLPRGLAHKAIAFNNPFRVSPITSQPNRFIRTVSFFSEFVYWLRHCARAVRIARLFRLPRMYLYVRIPREPLTPSSGRMILLSGLRRKFKLNSEIILGEQLCNLGSIGVAELLLLEEYFIQRGSQN